MAPSPTQRAGLRGRLAGAVPLPPPSTLQPPAHPPTHAFQAEEGLGLALLKQHGCDFRLPLPPTCIAPPYSQDTCSMLLSFKQVEKGLALLKEHGCDFIVSFGGGSSHDCAKGVGIVATNGGRIHDYEVRCCLSEPRLGGSQDVDVKDASPPPNHQHCCDTHTPLLARCRAWT